MSPRAVARAVQIGTLLNRIANISEDEALHGTRNHALQRLEQLH